MNGALDLRRLLLTGILLLIFSPKGQPRCSSLELYCPVTEKCEDFWSTACQDNCGRLQAACDFGAKCYTPMDRCNGQLECSDGVDEHDCDTSCLSFQEECDNGKTCYSYLEECDGYNKCQDGKDERNCEVTCSSYSCKTNPSECYSSYDRCDGTWDCSDGSDEVGCATYDDADEPTTSKTGLIVGIVVGIIAFIILVLCCKKAAQGNNEQTTNPPGAVAYHSAANYRQSRNFQVTHNHNNSERNGTYSNSPPPYDVVVRQNGDSNSNSSPAAFQSEHQYRRSSAEQPSNTSYSGYSSIYGPTEPGIGPSAPELTPPRAPRSAMGSGFMGPNSASHGPNSDYTATPATTCPDPVSVSSFPPPTGDTQQSPGAAPPPSYKSLYPEN